jgi:hypothetical protein
VTVYPENSQHPDVLGLTVSIIQANSFSVVSYLQKHGATEQQLARFKLESYSGSLAERLRVCLLAFREFLDGPAKDVVAGTRWEDVDALSQYR